MAASGHLSFSEMLALEQARYDEKARTPTRRRTQKKGGSKRGEGKQHLPPRRQKSTPALESPPDAPQAQRRRARSGSKVAREPVPSPATPPRAPKRSSSLRSSSRNQARPPHRGPSLKKSSQPPAASKHTLDEQLQQRHRPQHLSSHQRHSRPRQQQLQLEPQRRPRKQKQLLHPPQFHQQPPPPSHPHPRRAPATRSLEEHLQSMGLGQYLAVFHWAGASEAPDLALLDEQELAVLGVTAGDIQLLVTHQHEARLPLHVTATAERSLYVTTRTRSPSGSSQSDVGVSPRARSRTPSPHVQRAAAASASSRDMRTLIAAAVDPASDGDSGGGAHRPPTVAALAKAVPGLDTKPWACHVCTFLNDVPGTVFCGMCETRKRVTVVPAPPAPAGGSSPAGGSGASGASSSRRPSPQSPSGGSRSPTPRANLPPGAAAVAELSRQRRGETSELSPYIINQRLAANSHSRASMSRHNTARELKFAAKCLLLDLAASASESESASDTDLGAGGAEGSSRPRLRMTQPRTRTRRTGAGGGRAAGRGAGMEGAATGSQDTKWRGRDKGGLVNYVVDALGPSTQAAAIDEKAPGLLEAAAAAGRDARHPRRAWRLQQQQQQQPPQEQQEQPAQAGVAMVATGARFGSVSEITVGEVDDDDRVMSPQARKSPTVKLCDGFLMKRAASFPWGYRRRWFTLTISRTNAEPPMLYYSTHLIGPSPDGDSGGHGPSPPTLQQPPASAGTRKHKAARASNASISSDGGDSARGARTLTRDCCIQLNRTDVEQVSVSLGPDKAGLLQARQLQYLEFAVVRAGQRRGGPEEILRARAESHPRLNHWVHCLCHAILTCNE